MLVVTIRWFSVIPSFLSSSTAGLSSNSEISFTSIVSSPNPNIPAVLIVLAPLSCACLMILAAIGIVFPPAICIATTSPFYQVQIVWSNVFTNADNFSEIFIMGA